MDETRRRGKQGSGSWTGAVGTRPHEQPLDDWLGDISDEDWSENAAERAERRRATPAYQELAVPEGDLWRDPPAYRPAQAAPSPVADAHRALIERRRLLAGLLVVVALGLAVVITVLLLRGEAPAPVTPVPQPATTTPTTTATSPSSTPTTPSTTPTTTTPTTPSTSSASTFTLPEGTKLQRANRNPAVTTDLEPITDPKVVTELQHALSSAGYDPGTADGTFGQQTEAAVVAFQQANGLSPDGIVGPETASALNSALAGG